MAEIKEDAWQKKNKILVILAHPDDPEFFCGATLAKWAKEGHEIVYCLLTKGDKGTDDRNVKPLELANLRVKEQEAAARVIGAKRVAFLNYEDGYVIPDLDMRRQVVRVIRRERPDILVTSDPTNFISRDNYINHPDHRAAGQVVLDAYFPAAGNPMFFPELLAEGLEPHSVEEIWISIPAISNFDMDVTDTWEIKLKALHEHHSQIGDPQELDKHMLERHTPDSTPEAPRFVEKFKRIIFG
jgi:LmbE family N-acetylglucosaminyl deacetylase